jgi:hypothetical protein
MGLRTTLIENLIEKYSDLPVEVFFKEDLLRSGVAFTEDALKVASGFQPKAYFIFSFDLVPIAEMPNRENLRVPEEICLQGGRHEFRKVIVSVRVNPGSPYQVRLSTDGRLILSLEDEEVCEVVYPETPAYYGAQLKSGKPITDIAPVIEWGYLLYLTVFRLCQYFGRQEECQFCDINANYRQQKKSGRIYSGVKSVEEVLEALEIVNDSDLNSQAYTITGGSVTSAIQGQDEVEFYSQYPRAIEERFPGRWISKLGVQALLKAEVQRFKDAGVQIYHPNYEVWDPALFAILCPGKNRYVGRTQWINRVLDAATIFGASNVIPNFVAGIEMSKPHGFEDCRQAVDSTAEGISFFMSHGIIPRFTTWCPEPLSTLGASNDEGAPLEYHVRLLRTWRDLLESFHLPPPPGYGTAGIGRALFSVSSFMDVIRKNGGQ